MTIRSFIRISALAIVFCFCSQCYAAFENYHESTLVSILNKFAPKEDNEYLRAKGNTYFELQENAARVRVTYLGKSRPLTDERLKFLEMYFGGVLHHPEWGGLFKNELLFQEGERSFWLPIQEQLMPDFQREVTQNASVDLFVIYAGSFRDGLGELAAIFAVNEFIAVKP